MSELWAKLRTFFGMDSLPTLAKSTEPAKQCYARFASSQGFKLFPIQFEALAQFIADSAEEMSTETTKSYISHLRSYHIDKGYTTDVFNIKCILRGAACKYGKWPKSERLEITSEILQAVLTVEIKTLGENPF